jgi:hypothetical protein
MIWCIIEKTMRHARGDLNWLTDRSSCSISLERISLSAMRNVEGVTYRVIESLDWTPCRLEWIGLNMKTIDESFTYRW